jgi:hypothetical protein
MIEVSKVQVFDRQLKCIEEVELPERVYWVSGRSGIGESGLWYKGIGTSYSKHTALEPNKKDTILSKSTVLYGGYEVQYRNWVNRFGIFNDRMQWYFSEWIGGAGKRESKIVENSQKFSKSAVKVVDVISVIDDHFVYVMEIEGNKWSVDSVDKVVEVLKTMLEEGWNFYWDKGSIRDMNANGLVTDVADLFYSEDIKHKFGTVYSVVYSMKQLNKAIASDFEKRMNVVLDVKNIPFACLKVMKELGCDISGVYDRNTFECNWEDYKRLILDVLMEGRNCAGGEFEEIGREVRDMYKNSFVRSVKNAKDYKR